MTEKRAYARCSLVDEEHVSLCETLDRVLNKGVVVAGEVVISVADVDLIYLGLQLLLTSVENVNKMRSPQRPVASSRQGVAV